MEYSEDNQKLHCGECGKDYDPLARPGFLRFLSFVLISNLLILTVTMIHLIFISIQLVEK